ncbi:MAG: hypothetical protein HQL95_02390 [Magnetococcales bacterium]|nr:hypothetical protein [Magnetococcales bacterium]
MIKTIADNKIPVFMFIVISLFQILHWDRQGIDNPWIQMTGPWCNDTNSLYGYANQFDYSKALLHNENISLMADQLMLSGGKQNEEVYALRPGTGLISFLLFPYLSAMDASKILNKIEVTGAYIIAFLIFMHFGSGLPRAILATLMMLSLGIFNFHVNDFSGHLTSVIAWLGAFLLVLHARPWAQEKSLFTTLWVVCYLFYALLVYSFNIALIFALMAVMIGQWRKFLTVGLSLLIFIIYWRKGWPWILNSGYFTSISYGSQESAYTWEAINRWLTSLSSGTFPSILLKGFTEILFAEPLVALLFSASLLLIGLGWKRYAATAILRTFPHEFLFLILSALLSLMLGLFFTPFASARGYLTYGFAISSVVLFVVFSLPKFTQRKPEFLILALLAGLILWQQAWINRPGITSDPAAYCQYFLGKEQPTRILEKFITIGDDAIRLVGLDEQGSRTFSSFSDLSRLISEQFSEMAPSMKQFSVINSYYLLKSGIVRSYLFLTFLLAPFLALLVWTLVRQKGYSWLRSCSMVMGVYTVLWACWLGISWHAKNNSNHELLAHFLRVQCQQAVYQVKHTLTIDQKTLDEFERQQISRLVFYSGTLRFSEGSSKVSLKILPQTATPTEHVLTKQAPHKNLLQIPLALLLSSAHQTTAPLTVEIHEQLERPLRIFLAWNRTKPGAPGLCGTNLESVGEWRAYRQGDIVPRMILFANRKD